MNFQELKIYLINASALSITTFTQIEVYLKILLLLVTIGYTLTKWLNINKK